MENKKFKKTYLYINIPVIIIIFTLIILPVSVINKATDAYYVGILCRVLMALWCIFNGIWAGFTSFYSFADIPSFNRGRKAKKWSCVLLIVVGAWALITAFMGWGFNSIRY